MARPQQVSFVCLPSKRGDGQYHVQIRKRGYPTQTKTFTKEADARRWATIIDSETERGVFVSRIEAEATLVKDLLQRYADEVLPTKRSEQSDKSRIKTLLDAFGDYRMAILTSTQVAKFRDQRLQVVGPQSVIHEINLLNRVLKTATMDWGIALPGGLPTAQAREPVKSRGRARRVSKAEIMGILNSTGSLELSTIITIALETGMRRSELASLSWNEIDLKNRRRTFLKLRRMCRAQSTFKKPLFKHSRDSEQSKRAQYFHSNQTP